MIDCVDWIPKSNGVGSADASPPPSIANLDSSRSTVPGSHVDLRADTAEPLFDTRDRFMNSSSPGVAVDCLRATTR